MKMVLAFVFENESDAQKAYDAVAGSGIECPYVPVRISPGGADYYRNVGNGIAATLEKLERDSG